MKIGWLLFAVLLLVSCQAQPTLVQNNVTPIPLTDQAAAKNQLTGTLFAVKQEIAGMQITAFDLAQLSERTVFAVPANGWVNQIALAPDEQTLAVAYSPPADDGALRLDRSGIYLLSLAASEPVLQPLIVPPEPNQFLYTPVWSADGGAIFYVRSVVAIGSGADDLQVDLMRYDIATGATTVIAQDGIWPNVSPDGAWLTFVYVDPDTLERGLFVTDLNGGQRRELIPMGQFFDLDTPIFSADSQAIFLTIAREQPQTETTRSWHDLLLGVRVVQAHANHNIPSAWWRVAVATGERVQLSAESDIILHGVRSADDKQLYFATVTGLYALDSAAQQAYLLARSTAYRTIAYDD